MEDQQHFDQLVRHFQGINAANLTNIINTILALSVAVTAFGVNMLINAQKPLNRLPSCWFIASLFFLFLADIVGISILFTRLEDYRRTIMGAALQRDNPPETEELKRKVIKLVTQANRLNKATNILAYAQPGLFIAGFLCLGISVLFTHGAKLNW
jgi:hypothetical protein